MSFADREPTEEHCDACGDFYRPCACEQISITVEQAGRLAAELLECTADLRAAQKRAADAEQREAEAWALVERLCAGGCDWSAREEALRDARKALAARTDVAF